MLPKPLSSFYGIFADAAGHWLYYCEEIAGNDKLARRPKHPEEMNHPKDRIKTLIETRAEGGYIIIAPSGGGVHDTGQPYVLERGGLKTIDDLNALMSAEIKSERLEKVRDVFVFSCVTGMRFGELSLINKSNVTEISIELKEQKESGKETREIPLTALSKMITF